MSIASWLFGGGVDKVVATVDKFHFSDEERTKAFIEYNKATLPQNVARRVMAFGVVGLWAVACFFGLLMFKFDKEYSELLLGFANETLKDPAMLIIGFYFMHRFVMPEKK